MEPLTMRVCFPDGRVLGNFTASPNSSVADLKRQIADKASDGRSHLLQTLALASEASLKPTILKDDQLLSDAGVNSGSELTLLRMPCEEPHKRKDGGQLLPDLAPRLLLSGVYDQYVAWRNEYLSWRDGHAHGAHGELCSSPHEEDQEAAWRDKYRQWRRGAAHGAVGEGATACARPLASMLRMHRGSEALLRCAAPVVFDVTVDSEAALPALLPVDGPKVPPICVSQFPPDALVTIRVFRFFEDRSDASQVWEQELQNVNSGSLTWLPVQMAPGMHSTSGERYGRWFTVHYIKVYAKHFGSSYHMAEEGSSYPAKTFGSTNAITATVSGESLSEGYFWYVSPASSHASLASEGWQHICRDGPFDGRAFLRCWQAEGSPMEVRQLQDILHHACESPSLE